MRRPVDGPAAQPSHPVLINILIVLNHLPDAGAAPRGRARPEQRPRAMTDATPPTARRPALPFVLLWALGGSAAALSLAWPLWPRGETARPGPIAPPLIAMPFEAPGIRRPTTLPVAAATDLAADEPVVGVSAGGHSRAYLLRALAKDMRSHIVNDV